MTCVVLAAHGLYLAAAIGVGAEVLLVQRYRVSEGALQFLVVVLAVDAEVRVVVDEAAEHLEAVLAVGTGVQDVCMPDSIDLLARHQRDRRIQALESQETAIFPLRRVPLFCAHFGFGRSGVLVLETQEIQLADLHFQAVGGEQRLFQGNNCSHECVSSELRESGLESPPSLQFTLETLATDQAIRRVAVHAGQVEQAPVATKLETHQSVAAAHALAAKSGEGNTGPQGLINFDGLALVAWTYLMWAVREDVFDGVHAWLLCDDGASIYLLIPLPRPFIARRRAGRRRPLPPHRRSGSSADTAAAACSRFAGLLPWCAPAPVHR